jgi:integrase
MQYCQRSSHNDMLSIPDGELESRIRDYIVHLRHDKKLAPCTVTSYISPIVHFYEMNNFTLHWKRLKKFKAKHYSVVEDKPYIIEQIKTLLDVATLRDKCIILLMCSAGLRRGAFQYLRIRDIQKIEKYSIYQIRVYKREQEQYTTFCTPECARYIDQYLKWRQRLGEKLKDKVVAYLESGEYENCDLLKKYEQVRTAVSLEHLKKAISFTIGSDDRTVKKWLLTFRKARIIREVVLEYLNLRHF